MLHAEEARIRTFRVIPSLPEALNPLLEIAKNLWWTWTPDAVGLFCRLDHDAWTKYGHNPVKMLGNVSQDRLEEATRDEAFLNEIYRVYARLDQHCTRHSWFSLKHPEASNATIAYFSAEFGLTECLQIYSGGLGVLAGDHLKSASELGLPLVAIGLIYQNGYFSQYLSADGWQQETYPDLDFANQPVDRVRDTDNNWLKVVVDLPAGPVQIGVWKVQIGRIPLYLLDTNLPENSVEYREITRNLYGGDVEMRIQQEIILGIGGVRALTAMGIKPTVCHINEGHAAFLALERIRMLIEEYGITFDEALAQSSSSHVFTTHTPVPAGIDRFHPTLIEHYFRDIAPTLKISIEHLLQLGRENPGDNNDYFSMAVLAINTCNTRNGVSELHGKVSREMWRNLWPGVPEEEIPISHITNGTHTRSWLSRPMFQLFDRYLGYRWQHDPTDHAVWDRVEDIPDEEFWAVHSQQRRKLITWARRRIREQMKAHGATSDLIDKSASALDPDAFTIGFARRFATYKRGALMLSDTKRLFKLLNDKDRPFQLLIAGKAHPADTAGKEVIQEIVHFAKVHSAYNRACRIVFLENYNMSVARYLVSGCDLWLNTPKRGLEASGTSGMKAAVNGVINCSILDGWWDEAYQPNLGFAIGRRESYTSDAEANKVEASCLYDLLEDHILPSYYDRDSAGVPHNWIARMKQCIKSIAPNFNTNRMVQEYAEKLYVPAHQLSTQLADNNLEGAKGLVLQLQRYRQQWNQVKIEDVIADTNQPLPVEQPLTVEAIVNLGELTPEEIKVQTYTGQVSSKGDIVDGRADNMEHTQTLENGKHRFTSTITVKQSGRQGLAVRVIPNDHRLSGSMIPGLITWDKPAVSTKRNLEKPAIEQEIIPVGA